eukprot:TRINITY_DN2132_c0_g4_i1.p1 TRINITY_DN2132_c0_g4~~TRINITY_DN2132_c0_g4_i1.p1  ORF type:complete len:134 (-),score=6.10 TRINITY_DN2132_c0_g4_i1:18-419(-)
MQGVNTGEKQVEDGRNSSTVMAGREEQSGDCGSRGGLASYINCNIRVTLACRCCAFSNPTSLSSDSLPPYIMKKANILSRLDYQPWRINLPPSLTHSLRPSLCGGITSTKKSNILPLFPFRLLALADAPSLEE